MPIFVIVVFVAIVLCAVIVLAYALQTHRPSIGLAFALALGFVISGSIFWSALFGWNTLTIDCLWVVLVVGIFLKSALSAGKANNRPKEPIGWPSLAFFLTVAILFAIPTLILPVPLDTDAQGFGLLALAIRNSGSLTTLAPFHPEISYLYSPGFPAMAAYFSQQLHLSLQTIQLGMGTLLSLLFVWVAYDFGNEVADSNSRHTGIVMAFCAVIGTGLLTADLDSHYTVLMGLVFSLAFLTFAIRFQREGHWGDVIAATITLACVPLSQPDMTIILILGYLPWLIILGIQALRASPKRQALIRWSGLAVGIPLLAMISILPWLTKIAPMLSSSIQSPFAINTPYHLLVLVAYHGGVIVLLALIGIVIRLRRGTAVDWLMFIWLILIIDFSSLGIIQKILPWLPLFKYDYPFSIAWHGPIIPYMYFGAMALLGIMDRIGRERAVRWARVVSLPAMTGFMIITVVFVANIDSIVVASKNTPLQLYGAFSSQADIQAMNWLSVNTPTDALILNHPGSQEGDWVPIIAERKTVYFRWQPFYRNAEPSIAVQEALRAFWKNPADPQNAVLLKQYAVSYIIVPQAINQPAAIKSMFRWRPPLPEALGYGPVRKADVPYLELVKDFDGAQIYKVRDLNAGQ